MTGIIPCLQCVYQGTTGPHKHKVCRKKAPAGYLSPAAIPTASAHTVVALWPAVHEDDGCGEGQTVAKPG